MEGLSQFTGLGPLYLIREKTVTVRIYRFVNVEILTALVRAALPAEGGHFTLMAYLLGHFLLLVSHVGHLFLFRRMHLRRTISKT